MAVCRILHISDLHFAAQPWQIGLPERFRAWRRNMSGVPAPVSSQNEYCASYLAGFAFFRRDDYDAILVSGDLAITGKQTDLQAAHDFLFHPPDRGYVWTPDPGNPRRT